MGLKHETLELYKELKAKKEEYSLDEKNAKTDKDRIYCKAKKEAYNYVVRKLENNFKWLEIDF